MQSQRFPLSQALWLALLPLGACSSTGSPNSDSEQALPAQPTVVQAAPAQPGEAQAVEAQLESGAGVAAEIPAQNPGGVAAEDASLAAQDGASELQGTAGLQGRVEQPKRDEVFSTEGRTLDPRVAEVLASDRFQESFATSFLSVADVEPTMTQDEREAVLEFQRFMGQDVPDYERAQALLNAERGENTNEMFDFLQGWLFFGQERYEEAIPMLELAVDINRGGYPKFLRAHKILGFAYMSSDQPAKAAESLTRVIELGGGDALTFGLLGLSHSAAENFLAAERAFDMAILLDPVTEGYQLGLVTCYARQRKYQDAIALAQRLIDMHPEDPKFWLLQGTAYIGMEQPAKAAEKYEMAGLLGGATPESVSTLADIYANQGLFELSVNNYLRSLELDAKLGPERAIQACELMSYKGALDATQRLVDGVRQLRGEELTDKDRVQLLKLEARMAVANGSNDEEVAILEQVVELDPLDGEALLLLGQQAARTDELEKAIFYYERAAALDDTKVQADASVYKAYVLVRQQKYKQALSALDFAQSLNKRESIDRYIERVKRLDEKR
ncbi:MAG: tetratricopeptide repeat protein [Planctomycetota bacterium]|jgi:tetratricopeptide (TPR) repeat protein